MCSSFIFFGEAPFIEECLAEFPASVNRFAFWICLLIMSFVCVPGLSFRACSLWCRMSRRVSSFYGLICLLDLSSGFLEKGSLSRKMSHGVSFFCQQVLLLDMSVVYVFPRSLPSLWNFLRGFLIPLQGFDFWGWLQDLSSVFIFWLCLPCFSFQISFHHRRMSCWVSSFCCQVCLP